MGKSKLISREEWIRRFKSVHNKDDYDYSYVPEEIYQAKTIKIYCRIHHIFFQTTPTRLYNERKGCPKCKGDKLRQTKKNKIVTRHQFIEKAKLVHNDNYLYSELPLEFSLYDNLILFCKKHNHIFFCTGLDHLNGKGCGKE